MMRNKLILLSILILATLLRFYRLGDYPALNADEAAIGYNAYSLIQTGLDEHGNPWPIHFQSFNDYKPGLYFYLVLPMVNFFGLNEWSVRIPNALLGVLTIYLVYLLVTELKIKSKLRPELIAALFLAISPWHIHFSRGGWEVNTATFFMTLGVLLFIRGLRNLPSLFLSAFFFALSMYTYHAARIVSPLLVLSLVIIYFDEFKKSFGKLLLTGLVGLVCVLPIIKDLTQSDVLSRAAGVGLFADSGPVNRINEQRGEHTNFNDVSTKFLHNKAVNYTLAFFENWMAHYHGLFLFLSGDDIQRDKVPETGQMYMVDALWVVFGMLWMLKRFGKGEKLILYWLLISPLAAALTFQSPHALRAENMVIPLVIIAAIGFVNTINWLGSRKIFVYHRRWLSFAYLFIGLFVIWNFARYEHLYWVHMSKEYPYSSQYGVKELVSYVSENEDKYQSIVVTTRYDQPYILFLFYNTMFSPSKHSASDFQKVHQLTSKDQYGFSTVPGFGKYVFKPVNWEEDRLMYQNSMIVGAPDEIPSEANIVERVYGSNGFEYFNVVAN